MKTIQVIRKSLANAVRLVSQAADRRKTPVLRALGHIHVGYSKGVLGLEATDLDVALQLELGEATGNDGFEALLPWRELKECLRNGKPESIVKLSQDGPESESVTVTVGDVKTVLPTRPLDEWPTIPAPPEKRWTIGEELVAAVEKTRPATTTDLSRSPLQSLLLEKAGNVVGTDGHRLHVAPCQDLRALPRDLLMPIAQAAILKKLGKVTELAVTTKCEDGSAGCSDEHLHVMGPRVHLVARVEPREFPRWRAVVPKVTACTFRVQVDRAELLGVLKAAEPFASEIDSRGRRVILELNGTCTVKAKDPEKGQFEQQVSGCRFKYGKDAKLTIGFNVQYLKDALQVCESDRVWFRTVDENGPAAIQEDGLQATIMPMRV